MLRGACLAALFACCLTAAPAIAQSSSGPPPAMAPAFEDPPPYLTLSSGEGRIALRMLAPAGATVTFSEGVDGQAAAIREVAVDPAPSPLPSATVVGAITWRCDRLVRRSVAFAIGPDGRRTQAAAEIRTPDRKERLEVVVRPGAANGVARFRVGGDAVWSARAPHPDGAADPLLTVGGATRTASTKGLPRIPVAGDSLMQDTHAFVAGRPRTAFDVTVDTRPGTGLAEPSAASWPGLAKQHAQRLKPAVTVISLRVSDGIPLEGEECCGPVRVARYATAARALMRTYVRGGRGHLIRLTAPLPRDARLAGISRAVNAGTRQAAAGQ